MWSVVKIAVLIADNALRQSFITVFDEFSERRSGNAYMSQVTHVQGRQSVFYINRRC